MGNLNLEKIELREIELPLKTPFETSFGVTSKRRVMIVKVIDKSGASGYGECVAMEHPFYNPETVETAWAVIIGCLVPILRSVGVKNACEVDGSFAAVKGNRMAIAAIETAVWDLEARILGLPLWQHLGGTLESIACGVSIGLHKDPASLIETVDRELKSGYRRIKLKIKPGSDIEFVKAVRSSFPDILLSVDANSAYRLEQDLDVLRQLDDFDLLMIEQPLNAGDLLDHAKLQAIMKTPICLDESITCLRDARQAIDIDACRIINIKLGRVGGHTAAKQIQELAKENKMPVWCGGMLETGIGRAHNIAMSTLDGFTLPGDVSASSRYWEQDVIDPPVSVNDDGTIDTILAPGIGYEIKEEHIVSLTTKFCVLSVN